MKTVAGVSWPSSNGLALKIIGVPIVKSDDHARRGRFHPEAPEPTVGAALGGRVYAIPQDVAKCCGVTPSSRSDDIRSHDGKQDEYLV